MRYTVRSSSLHPASLAAILAAILVTIAAIGCKAQNPPPSANPSTTSDPALTRKIEILVRGRFNIPSEYSLALGTRKPSNFPGYDSLQIILSKDTRTTPVDMLISTDNKSLARFESFDLANIPALNIPIDNRPIRGNPSAKVTVINFDDLECPYCARMHQQLFPATLDRYKDKVRFIYKDFPLTEIHPWALHAAVDSHCLAVQNASAYWGYVDYLHAHGQEVTGEDRNLDKSNAALDRIAAEQGKIFSLDAPKLDDCLKKQDESEVRASMKEGETLGVEGTPYLFVDGEKINGAVAQEEVWAVIDRALRAAGIEPPPPPADPAPTPKLGQ